MASWNVFEDVQAEMSLVELLGLTRRVLTPTACQANPEQIVQICR